MGHDSIRCFLSHILLLVVISFSLLLQPPCTSPSIVGVVAPATLSSNLLYEDLLYVVATTNLLFSLPLSPSSSFISTTLQRAPSNPISPTIAYGSSISRCFNSTSHLFSSLLSASAPSSTSCKNHGWTP